MSNSTLREAVADPKPDFVLTEHIIQGDWSAVLGDVTGRGYDRETAIQSLGQKLELLKQRAISTARTRID